MELLRVEHNVVLRLVLIHLLLALAFLLALLLTLLLEEALLLTLLSLASLTGLILDLEAEARVDLVGPAAHKLGELDVPLLRVHRAAVTALDDLEPAGGLLLLQEAVGVGELCGDHRVGFCGVQLRHRLAERMDLGVEQRFRRRQRRVAFLRVVQAQDV